MGRVLFCTESEGRRESLRELLAPLDLRLEEFTSLEAFQTVSVRCGILVAPLEKGCLLQEQGLALVCESELLGQRIIQRRRRDKQKASGSNDAIIRNLAELTIGQPVVHLDHGVGRYLGLQNIDAGGIATEYLTLEYADEAKLYVPRHLAAPHQPLQWQ